MHRALPELCVDHTELVDCIKTKEANHETYIISRRSEDL